MYTCIRYTIYCTLLGTVRRILVLVEVLEAARNVERLHREWQLSRSKRNPSHAYLNRWIACAIYCDRQGPSMGAKPIVGKQSISMNTLHNLSRPAGKGRRWTRFRYFFWWTISLDRHTPQSIVIDNAHR